MAARLAALESEVERLEAENQDLRMLYEATIEHGEAVEDQLAESNILLTQIQDRLKAELSDARRYIMSLLPEPRLASPRTDWLLLPSTELGGDAFGYHEIDADHFAIYLLDVCGHGVGAALLSASVLNVLRAGALPAADFRDPSAVLAGLNTAFPMERQNNMFFTFWYGVYQASTGCLTYANGGHPPAILLRRAADGTTSGLLLEGESGLAIGALEDMSFPNQVHVVEPGDRLIVLSDGTFEVGADTGNLASLHELLASCLRPDADHPDAVLTWSRGRHGGEILPDDFTYLRVTF
jgi:sigma-B regulation protein RsbU (phosphoserine phosphatase)